MPRLLEVTVINDLLQLLYSMINRGWGIVKIRVWLGRNVSFSDGWSWSEPDSEDDKVSEELWMNMDSDLSVLSCRTDFLVSAGDEAGVAINKRIGGSHIYAWSTLF